MTDTDPGLERACAAALSEFYASKDKSSARVVTANSLCRYWAEEDPYEADRSEPLLLPKFLSQAEIDECHHAVTMSGWRVPEESEWISPDGKDVVVCEALEGVAHDMVFTDKHVVLYLHCDGYFQQHHAALWQKINHRMQSQLGEWDDPASELLVRCIEFHTYAIGGGLLSPMHRDNGSVFTMSVMLSEPGEGDGGQFVTYSEGLPIVHQMKKGDAILFQSEKLHNVATVTGGTRNSLVVELWKPVTNTKNRFS